MFMDCFVFCTQLPLPKTTLAFWEIFSKYLNMAGQLYINNACLYEPTEALVSLPMPNSCAQI